ncbi:hypothetical protein J3F84DRAFT_403739 [Trichoderma pleuroticola]
MSAILPSATAADGTRLAFENRYLEFLIALSPYRNIIWLLPALCWQGPRFWRTLKSNAFTRAYKMPYSIFAIHVVVSLVELVKYHRHSWLDPDDEQTASTLDVVLCVIQSWTSLYIASKHHHVRKTAMEVTRATFHCMGLQRILATGMALYTGASYWHVASIALLNNFIWARILIGARIGGMRWRQRYVMGIVASHLLGMYNGDYPHGIAIYCGLMIFLLNLDTWAKGRDSFTARIARYYGFASPPEWYEKEV